MEKVSILSSPKAYPTDHFEASPTTIYTHKRRRYANSLGKILMLTAGR